MSEDDAKEAVEALRQGRAFRQGHYAAGHVTIFFEPETGRFVVRREDTALDWTNPHVEEERLDEAQLVGMLVAELPREDFMTHLT